MTEKETENAFTIRTTEEQGEMDSVVALKLEIWTTGASRTR
jgi:hypothetical protein